MTMTHVWDYRDPMNQQLDRMRDLVGYDVEASDGHIGKIDEASTDTSRQFIVVDTGFWIFGKKRLIPAGVVSTVDHDDKKVFVSMTKDQIKSAPDYDKTHEGDDEAYYDSFGDYYRNYGW